MKIEKLTENKIRIILNLEELSKNNIDLKKFMMSNIESQKFFLDILNKAEKEVGFKTQDCKLLIESFTSIDEVLVFTITKFSIKKNKLKYNKNKKTFKNPIYKFDSFEEFCSLCQAIKKLDIPINGLAKNISLYLYNNTYYLSFSNLNLTYTSFKRLFCILSEFATLVNLKNNFDGKLLEYGKPIIKQNAFKTGIKYFV